MRSQASIVIDRPVEDVFSFWADGHVENHPRWDPNIELWHDSDPPLTVGSTIRRRNSRSGQPVDGSMKVVQWEPNRNVVFSVQDGPMEFAAGGTFDPVDDGKCQITTWADIPGIDDATHAFITSEMERTVATIKELMEQG